MALDLFLPAEETTAVQGSDEWLTERLGLATSSEYHSFLDVTKSGEYTAARKHYRTQLVLERLTGKTPERFKTRQMEWGNDTEELAATMYSLQTGIEVRECGMFRHKFLAIGDSPDRMVIGQPGTVEIKCYESANHMEALRSGHMPILHKPQVQNHIYMTGSEWCDFVSFDPDFPPETQLFIERIYRDDEYIKHITLQASIFLDEVDEDIKFINNYKGAYGTR